VALLFTSDRIPAAYLDPSASSVKGTTVETFAEVLVSHRHEAASVWVDIGVAGFVKLTADQALDLADALFDAVQAAR
jgi:hypothetical protein